MSEKRVEAAAKFLFTHAGFNWDTTSELARDGFRQHAREILTAADAAAPQAVQAYLPLLLLRDLCRELGIGVPDAVKALRAAGLGDASQGSAVTPEMANALRAATPPAQAQPASFEREFTDDSATAQAISK